MNHPGFMKVRDVYEYTGIGRSKFQELAKKGIFPKPLKLGARKALYRRDVVDDLCQRIDAGEFNDCFSTPKPLPKKKA